MGKMLNVRKGRHLTSEWRENYVCTIVYDRPVIALLWLRAIFVEENGENQSPKTIAFF